jgi:predicted DNA-binding helix-hairpin-helix protein
MHIVIRYVGHGSVILGIARNETNPHMEEHMPGAIGDAHGVDLNTANQQDLERVGGLGPDRARRIIQQRPFQSWDDLKKKVEGLSDTLVDDLKRAGATIGGRQAA